MTSGHVDDAKHAKGEQVLDEVKTESEDDLEEDLKAGRAAVGKTQA